MKNKIFIMLLVSMLIAYPTIVYADIDGQLSYASATVNYIVGTKTTFTYTQIPTATTMDFKGNKNSQGVPPEGTNNGNNPWASIANTGDTYQNFVARLDSNNPQGIVLVISNNQNMNENMAVTTSANSPPHWTNVSNGSSIYLYARANFNGASDGTVTRTLKVGLSPVLKSVYLTPQNATVKNQTALKYDVATLDQFDMAIPATLDWTVENKDVGVISNAYFSALAVGTTSITVNATAGGKTISNTTNVTVVS